MRFVALIFALVLCGGASASAQDRALRPLPESARSGEDSDGQTMTLPLPDSDQIAVAERNGEWTLSLRIGSPGAAGLQLYVENMRLPEGARLSLYEIDSSGERGNPVAAYTGVGPLLGDAFWTAALAGGEVLAEVTFPNGSEGTLPFTVTSLRHLTSEGLEKLIAVREQATEETIGGRGFARFRGAVVPYEVRNGLAIFEGDIVLGSVGEIDTVSSKEANGRRESMGITNTYYRWTGGVVPYEIDPTLPNQYRITDAVAHWNTQLAGTITLRPRSGEAYFVKFVNTASAGTCSSYIGNVHLAGQAVTVGSYCSTGNVIHEVGHAIGLYHEHTREDRDRFVKINFANIDSTKTSNFNQAITSSDDLGAYDFGSIMHYPATAFSINGQPTIETIPAGIPIGQRSALSTGDMAGVRAMYPNSTTPPSGTVSVTVGSNPSGREIVVDGVSVTAPATFQWIAGSAHTVYAPSVTSGSTRYIFKSWSNGGAQTQTVTVPSTTFSLTASFQKQHSFVATSSNVALGSVSNSPVAADTFYNEGTSITVAASATASACLSGWSGITAPASSPIAVTLTQPLTVVGNFQSGAISVSKTSFTIPTSGGTFALTVTSTGGCAWTAKSSASWITIKSGATGTATGDVVFAVSRLSGKKSRTGTITIGNLTITVTQ